MELTGKRVKNLKNWEKIGRAKKSESLSAQSRLGLVEADLLALQQELLDLRLNLPAVAGLPSHTTLKDSVKEPSEVAPLETYLDLKNRGDVLSKMEAVESARKVRAAAWSAHFPTLDAEGNYYVKRSGNLKGVDWDLSLNLEVPIFSGGSVLARRQQADEQVFQRQKEYEQSILDSRKEIESLYHRVQSLKSQVTTLKRAAEETKSSYLEQNRDYQRGMVTNLEVLEALSTYIDTQKRWKNSIYDLQQARLDLDLASGVLKP